MSQDAERAFLDALEEDILERVSPDFCYTTVTIHYTLKCFRSLTRSFRRCDYTAIADLYENYLFQTVPDHIHDQWCKLFPDPVTNSLVQTT